MGAEEYSAKYVTLVQYADEMGISPTYLRGAIYSHEIELPVFGGAAVVDEASRKLLAPLVQKIKDGVVRTGRTGRPRKPLASPA